MILHRSTPYFLALFSLPLVPVAAQSTFTDHYTMRVEGTSSHVQYVLDTSLGPVALEGGGAGVLTGEMDVLLHSGSIPIASGEFDGGACVSHPDLVGRIASTQPGHPARLELRLTGLVLESHSTPFACAPQGDFSTMTSLEVASGTLAVSLDGAPFVSLPIAGLTSDSAIVHGQASIDALGIHIGHELHNTFDLSLPPLAMTVTLGVDGRLLGDMPFPVPERYCPAAPNSTGLPAKLDFSGTPSVSRNDGQLLVSQCAPNTKGFFIAGDQQAQLPFGAGTLCVSGQPVRLDTVKLSGTGTGGMPLDLRKPALSEAFLVGSRWNFQFLYQDGVGNLAKSNGSDALSIVFVP